MRKTFTSSVFLVRQNRVLLVHHKRFDLWLPIGGEIEPNESPLDAAIRETREETGIVLVEKNFLNPMRPMPGAPKGLMGFEQHEAGSKGLQMNFVFVAQSPTLDVVLSAEHKEFKWFELDEYPDETTENVEWCLGQIWNG